MLYNGVALLRLLRYYVLLFFFYFTNLLFSFLCVCVLRCKMCILCSTSIGKEFGSLMSKKCSQMCRRVGAVFKYENENINWNVGWNKEIIKAYTNPNRTSNDPFMKSSVCYTHQLFSISLSITLSLSLFISIQSFIYYTIWWKGWSWVSQESFVFQFFSSVVVHVCGARFQFSRLALS